MFDKIKALFSKKAAKPATIEPTKKWPRVTPRERTYVASIQSIQSSSVNTSTHDSFQDAALLYLLTDNITSKVEHHTETKVESPVVDTSSSYTSSSSSDSDYKSSYTPTESYSSYSSSSSDYGSSSDSGSSYSSSSDSSSSYSSD